MPSINFEEALEELFTDLHLSGLFADGKEIADAILTKPPSEVLKNYRLQKKSSNFDLKAFYKTYFLKAPTSSTNYKSDTSLSVDTHINQLWDVLTRQADKANNSFSSLIPLPHPYIVPGGRFNEIYYWDSYFTMLGLQESGRVDMIEHMLDNFAYLIETVGFIPNGNRTYFLGRSQPPFFACMVQLLAEEKGDATYQKYLPALEKEYAFWMNEVQENRTTKRVVKVEENAFLNRYFDNHIRPRTEMYADDVELLEKGGTDAQKLLLDIRAACESGWDFSSRWCHDPMKLETIHTTDIIPIDLNCLLYQLELTLSNAYKTTNNTTLSKVLLEAAEKRFNLLQKYCWNKEKGYFFDYDFIKGEQTNAITAAGLFPLFFKIAEPSQAKACATILNKNLLSNGGLLTTPITSGQQWDAPNGWAPLQWIAIKGLRNYGLHDLANTIQSRWTALNTKVYQNTGKLMEKYNVVDTDLESGGGEYPVQDGFGWTNGVLLKLLKS